MMSNPNNVACAAFERAAALNGFDHPSRAELGQDNDYEYLLAQNTPPPLQRLPFGVASVASLLRQQANTPLLSVNPYLAVMFSRAGTPEAESLVKFFCRHLINADGTFV